MTPCSFVPPYLLERINAAHPDRRVCECCRDTLAVDAEIRGRRAAGPAAPLVDGPFSVHDAAGGTTLPGPLARSAGQEPVGDPAVDEAYDGVQASLALFAEAFGRTSYDDRGAPVVATVHYGRDYDNAFWDGSQLVFGDGDGEVFERFTKPVDVLGHEFTHAVTQHTSGFEYSGQSGALNESVSDVFAACLKQRLLGQTADEADWLIGEGIFTSQVQGRALRSMAEPGTAYDDPVLGKDPQVGSMVDYVETTEDNGGVHLNSGIPNRAFHLAAVAIGGPSWEVPGRIWYAALTSGIGPTADFAEFAGATVAAAASVAGGDAVGAVVAAWREVGVQVADPVPGGTGDVGEAGGSGGAESGGAGDVAGAESGGAGHAGGSGTGGAGGGGNAGEPGGAPAPTRVVVSRSGGFAGLRHEAEVRLGEDPRTPAVERLLNRVDLAALRQATGSRPQPDRYVYAFLVDGEEIVLGEQDLTPELDALARIVLDD